MKGNTSMSNRMLVKPAVDEIYLNNNEKAVYINLPENYEEYSLEYDINHGGVQYTELLKLMEKGTISRVVSLTCDSMEMGAMAVSYLAMNMAKRQGRYEEEYSFAIDPDSLWSESDRKIPIITIHQLITYMRRSEMPYAQNGFLVAQAQSYERKKPYWCDCKTKSVCVVVERQYADSTCLNCIKMFSTNKNVYVIFIDKKPYDEEFDGEIPFGCMDSEHFMALRNNFILVNASDAVEVSFAKNSEQQYYKNIFKQNLSVRNIKVKRGFSYDRIVNLAKSINKDSMCDMIDRIIAYAIKDMDSSTVNILSNRDFDFVDHFMRDNVFADNAENGKELMEKNLVGMQEIKQQVYDIVNVMKYNKLRKQMNISGSNFHNVHVMLGAPGTAKTTVARYMGQMMFNEKLLPDNRYICINGAELKGKYVGHSAPNTKKLFENYDVIINAILWDTTRKDHIIYRSDLKRMKRGSIIIDISCDRNGGIETSVPTTIENPIYVVDGVAHYVVDHTPSLFYKTTSGSLSEVFVQYIDNLIKADYDSVLKGCQCFEKGLILDGRIKKFQNR